MDQATPAAASSITNITNTQVMGNQTNISKTILYVHDANEEECPLKCNQNSAVPVSA